MSEALVFFSDLTKTEVIWLTVGLLGQLLFFGRFVFQWIASEKEGRSVIPVIFWYLSLGGTLLLLSYSIYRRDPIFILGFSLNMVIYIRNLMLIQKSNKTDQETSS